VGSGIKTPECDATNFFTLRFSGRGRRRYVSLLELGEAPLLFRRLGTRVPGDQFLKVFLAAALSPSWFRRCR